MQLERIHSILDELGLHHTEQVIYLMLLQVGSAPASVLGQRTGITKSTAQYACQQLTKKGLISMLDKANTYIYRAEDPRRLLQFLEKKKAALDASQEHVQQIIAPLKEMMQPQLSLPRIRVYEGFEQVTEGLWHMLDSMKSGDEMLSFVHPLSGSDSLYAGFFDSLARFGDERSKRKIFRKMLIADTPQARQFIKETDIFYWEVRIAPKNCFSCEPSEIIIYNDTVWCLSIEQGYPFAYTAQHRALSTLQRDAFNLAWKQAEPKAKK